MWKLALLSLAAVLSAVQGYYNNGLGVSSWDRMLAELMQGRTIQTGTCDNDMCYVKIGVGVEDRVLKRGEAFFPDRSTDPCLQYVCESSGVKQRRIKCQPVTCNNGAPVRYPRTCCQQCVGPSGKPVEFTKWGEWTECSRTCGGGKRARERACIIPDGEDLAECTGELRQVRDCNNDPCPVNCKWEWEPFGQCSKPCGGGKRSRFPIIRQPAEHGGRPCPPFVENRQPETEDCNTNPCPRDCVWELWSAWSGCTKTCGGGSRTRSRGKVEEMHGGEPCVGPATQRETCNATPCPVDCVWEWGPFGKCSRTCGGGTMSRYPNIKIHPQHGGKECPPNVPDTEKCNTETCPEPLCPDGQHWCDGVCIPDEDKDCVADNKDNCKYKYNPKQNDEDGDGVGDDCDNCKYAYNPEQENTDSDATGDACDEDDDNDGVVDGQDNCPLVPNPDQSSKDPYRYGAKCFHPKGSSAMRMDNDDMPTGSDKKGLAAEIMEKLLEMYHSK